MATKLSERRSGLDALLHSIVKQRCGSENVYYQPPANLRMKYPCICYKLEKIRSPKADDRVYRQTFHYSVILPLWRREAAPGNFRAAFIFLLLQALTRQPL